MWSCSHHGTITEKKNNLTSLEICDTPDWDCPFITADGVELLSTTAVEFWDSAASAYVIPYKVEIRTVVKGTNGKYAQWTI